MQNVIQILLDYAMCQFDFYLYVRLDKIMPDLALIMLVWEHRMLIIWVTFVV